MQNMYKNNTLVLIQERVLLNVSKNLTICSLMVVFSPEFLPSLRERGGIRFYLPLPGESVWSYLRTDVG